MLLGILGVACMFIPGLMQAEGVRRVGAQRAAIGSTDRPADHHRAGGAVPR